MDTNAKGANWLLGMAGAAAGGAVGCLAFFWIARQGFYALVLPGAAVGLGCAALSRGKSNGLGIVCGGLGVLIGLLAEWRFAPFAADPSLGYFLTHLHHLQPVTVALVFLGGAFAFWLGRGNARPRNSETEP
jgi:hypothetical protein